jgi:hypothetical protein
MNRKIIIEKLLSEGFTEKTLSRLSDKELTTLSNTVLKESSVMIKKDNVKDIEAAKKAGKTIETYESKVCPKCGMKNCKCKDKKHGDVNEEKPSAGLSKEKKSEVVKKAKKGEDIGKKGKSFKDIEKKAKESGAKDPKAVAASAMWKNIQRENVSEVEEWVLDLAESKYTQFTSKKDIMSIINEKMETYQPMPVSKPKKGHNGVPEFMTYDSIISAEPSTAPSKPDVDTPVKPKTPEKPTKPRTPYQPGPGTDPKPKALAEKKKK